MALSLGRRNMGRVWPNPAVGCVIVQDGRVVGRGWTAQGGRPHAEAYALTQAGDAARGATAYVTLEPCAHIGQTPPCADALAAAGIVRVVCALGDPDPRVAGKGFRRLEEAGISVETGPLEAQARIDHSGFLSRVRRGRPLVTLKLAQSVDGRIATSAGESRWITGPAARRYVHKMRLDHDAVMIGAGTARADDPMLDIRDMGDVLQPVRIVVSADLNLPIDGRLAQTAREVPLWLVHGADADATLWENLGAISVPVSLVAGRVPVATALQELGLLGLTRVLCEGGGSLAASLLQADCVDRLVSFNAGLTLGADGTPSVADMGLRGLDDARRYQLVDARQLGADVMQVWDLFSPKP